MWGTKQSAPVVGGGSEPAPPSRVNEERLAELRSLVKQSERLGEDVSAVKIDTASMTADLKQVIKQTEAILAVQNQILQMMENDSGKGGDPKSATASGTWAYTPAQSPKTPLPQTPVAQSTTPEDNAGSSGQSQHSGHCPDVELFRDKGAGEIYQSWWMQTEQCRASLGKINAERQEFSRVVKQADDDLKAAKKEFEAKLADGLRELRIKNRELDKEADEYCQKLGLESQVNQEMLNRLRDLEGNIRVMVRIRPASEQELRNKEPLQDFGDQFPGTYNANWATFKIPQIEKNAQGGDRVKYREVTDLARIFDSTANAYNVARELEYVIRAALDGEDSTVFAYGPSGSGKSFTMTNPDDDTELRGVIPTTIEWFFTHADYSRATYDYTFLLSAIEVYMDEVYDLLVDAKQPRKIRHGDEKKARIRDQKHGLMELENALSKRQVDSTEKNSSSSRSHFIVRLDVIRASRRGAVEPKQGSVTFVDLAGSEKLTDAAGKLRQEGMSINASLSDLTTMIGQLAQRRRPTPVKKLGKILKSSFTPESRIAMITCISPLQKDFVEHTVPTLQTVAQVNATTKRSAAPAAPRSRATPSSGTPARGGPSAQKPAASGSSTKIGIGSSSRVASTRDRK